MDENGRAGGHSCSGNSFVHRRAEHIHMWYNEGPRRESVSGHAHINRLTTMAHLKCREQCVNGFTVLLVHGMSSCSAVPVGPVETVESKGVLWLVVILQSGVTPSPGRMERQHLKEAGKNALANLASALGSAPYLVSFFYTVLTEELE